MDGSGSFGAKRDPVGDGNAGGLNDVAQDAAAAAERARVNSQQLPGEMPGAKAKLPPMVTGNEKETTAVSNCLGCGRIYSGVWFVEHARCAFCGVKLRSGKFLRGGKASEAVAQDAALARARAQRDRLVEWDETVDMQAKVMDDQEDFYETIDSVWASYEEREQAWDALEGDADESSSAINVSLDSLMLQRSSSREMKQKNTLLSGKGGRIYEALSGIEFEPLSAAAKKNILTMASTIRINDALELEQKEGIHVDADGIRRDANGKRVIESPDHISPAELNQEAERAPRSHNNSNDSASLHRQQQHRRKRKDKDKARVGNHSRKKGAAKKASRGMM